MSSFEDIYRGQSVLVTGHTGFKGGWLGLWLHQLGAVVHGYSRDIPTNPALFEMAQLGNVLHHNIGDVRDLEHFQRVLHQARPRFVFHLAAQPIVSRSYSEPIETISTNVIGTNVVLEALRSVDWPCAVVMITSDKCYDNVEWVWGYRETDALGGKDVYSGSKGAAELVIRCYVHSFFQDQHPVRIAVGRAGNVIGGGDWAADRIVVDCVRSWCAGERVLLRSPSATRPWQHVLEPLSGYLALGAALAATTKQHGEAFNFGPRAEQSRTVVELLNDLARIWGHSVPEQSYEIVDQIPFHEAGLLKLNCDKALLALRWSPVLNYQEAVQMTGEWYRAVLQDKADAQSVSLEQITAYENLAVDRKLAWSGSK